MKLHITLNVQKKLQVVDCRIELLTVMVRIKTLTYLDILLRGNIDSLAFKNLVSWEVIIVRTNSAEKYYNWLLDMLDNDNIMTAKASEVVQKVPTDEKDCHKCSLCVIVSI